MADKLNPGEKSVGDEDYDKKFNHPKSESSDAKDLKTKESEGETNWKTNVSEPDDSARKKKRFGLKGRRGGKMQKGAALTFIVGFIGLGIWYTSVLAPNILLVNVKEMYTNDLADATTALEIYTQIAYFNKIGPLSGQDCVDGQPMSSQPIKCKLTTISRAQKQAFERQGFTFGLGDINIGGFKTDAGNVAIKKVYEDKRDDGDFSNDLPESRYKVYAIIPPNYKQVIDSAAANGISTFSDITRVENNTDVQVVADKYGTLVEQLFNPMGLANSSPDKLMQGLLQYAPITSGPQLWLYAQLSSTAKVQVYSVFNPRSSFFADAKFKERIKTRYNMTKQLTVTGDTESEVNRSFDDSVQKIDGGLDPLSGQPNPTDGVSLASLSSPLSLTQVKSLAGQLLSGGVSTESVKTIANNLPVFADLQVAGNLLATNTYSYTDLMCSWYTIGKISSNALIRAKASTAARYALQYLKAADSIKSGSAKEVPTNVLASKLAQHTIGGYGGGSATDSFTYRSITYGDYVPDAPSDIAGLVSAGSKVANLATDLASIVAYNLSAYENIATLAASWAQIIPNAAALGSVIGGSGALTPPPGNLTGADRDYCLSGETLTSKTAVKGETTETTRCTEAVTAMVPPGMQGAMAGAVEVARRTCPPVNALDDNPIRFYLGDWRGPISNTVLPSQKLVQVAMTPYVAGWFGVNTMLAAAGTQQLYTSQIKGIAANYALFSGMGELLGDMAMSRGLQPSNTVDMMAYLMLGEVIGSQGDADELERHNAKQNPFDPYNKFSFVGMLMRGMPASSQTDSPVFSTLTNVLSLVGASAQRVARVPSASAFYHIQPTFITTSNMAERIAGYTSRLSSAYCPLDLEYLAIGITPDIMCNVRYSMPLDDLTTALDLNGIIQYMTSSHSDVYDSKLKEFRERVGKADVLGGEAEYLGLKLAEAESVKSKPFIDKNTGKPTKGGEYEKYLQYCVNRLDPWGRSAIAMQYDGLSESQKSAREAMKDQYGNAVDRDDPGDPNQKYVDGMPVMAVWSAQSDIDWYTGKKCTRMTDQSEMLKYFRAYTTLCSVDGSMSNITDCTQPDNEGSNYSDPFYLNNDILFTSWN